MHLFYCFHIKKSFPVFPTDLSVTYYFNKYLTWQYCSTVQILVVIILNLFIIIITTLIIPILIIITTTTVITTQPLGTCLSMFSIDSTVGIVVDSLAYRQTLDSPWGTTTVLALSWQLGDSILDQVHATIDVTTRQLQQTCAKYKKNKIQFIIVNTFIITKQLTMNVRWIKPRS